ncbi:FxLYD domain-containing protein [Streptomyces sp. NPDC003077]|uniref:FxLYD domain-containing protein n=1 Tax=Streptomyces sp. NPDC003077 TaxID=3154443 RepID=UPI0033B40BAD
MRTRPIIVGAAIAVITLTGCMPGTAGDGDARPVKKVQGDGSGEVPIKEEPPAAKPSAPTSTTTAEKDTDPKADVRVDSCGTDDFTGWPAAQLSITNRSDRESNYIITIEFVDASGTRLGSALAAENNVRPGQRAQTTAQGLKKVSAKASCRVASVTRYASP